ncbi:MAG: hypothetical protein KAR44_02280 [Candidatus Aegiribacteria sp.]|nr:hypothetical protein [Candidatus Aegiribacteria sp.]
MKVFLIVMFGVLLIPLACGGDQPAEDVIADENDQALETYETEEYDLPEADFYMTVTDSIGIEFGDSNYVLGQVAGADILPDGSIAVLDPQSSSIKLYSPECEFLMSLGRHGSGPGEFLSPVAMACFPEGEESAEPDSVQPGLVVADAMGGKLIYFDRNLEYMMDLQGFIPSPPVRVTAVNGGAIVGMKLEYEQSEEGMFMGTSISRWPLGDVEPSTVYFKSMSPFDPSDLSSMQEDNTLSFAASPDGMVLTAPVATDIYTFSALTPDGEEIFTVIDDDFERVLKTQEEIDIETEVVNINLRQVGMDPEMANWEPNPYRPAIAGLAIDGHGRIWVRKGTIRLGTFNVYDLDGNFLYTVALDTGERAENWVVVIKDDQFLAYDEDPEYYPQVFIGDLPLSAEE